jgi:hypothetical protein
MARGLTVLFMIPTRHGTDPRGRARIDSFCSGKVSIVTNLPISLRHCTSHLTLSKLNHIEPVELACSYQRSQEHKVVLITAHTGCDIRF